MSHARKRIPEPHFLPDRKKEIRASVGTPSGNDKTPKWRFQSFDWGGPFCLCPHPSETITSMLKKLGTFERMPWAEIKQQTHDIKKNGHGRSSNHFIEIDSLKPIAKRRLEELGYQYISDLLFSLRLQNTERVIGILRENTFDILWYDPNHSVSKSLKKGN